MDINGLTFKTVLNVNVSTDLEKYKKQSGKSASERHAGRGLMFSTTGNYATQDLVGPLYINRKETGKKKVFGHFKPLLAESCPLYYVARETAKYVYIGSDIVVPQTNDKFNTLLEAGLIEKVSGYNLDTCLDDKQLRAYLNRLVGNTDIFEVSYTFNFNPEVSQQIDSNFLAGINYSMSIIADIVDIKSNVEAFNGLATVGVLVNVKHVEFGEPIAVSRKTVDIFAHQQMIEEAIAVNQKTADAPAKSAYELHMEAVAERELDVYVSYPQVNVGKKKWRANRDMHFNMMQKALGSEVEEAVKHNVFASLDRMIKEVVKGECKESTCASRLDEIKSGLGAEFIAFRNELPSNVPSIENVQALIEDLEEVAEEADL